MSLTSGGSAETLPSLRHARIFSPQDIDWFAGVSGDPNPVHIDAEFAARTYPGVVVAHGAHLVLWTLEGLQSEEQARLADGVTAVFTRPVAAGETVEVARTRPGAVRLHVNGNTIARIRLEPSAAPERWVGGAPAHRPSHPPVIEAASSPPGDVAGAVLLPESGEALVAAFPRLGELFGAKVLQGLAGVATASGAVVGGVTMELSAVLEDNSPGGAMEYRLETYRAAFRRFELAFRGSGVAGRLAAVVAA